MNESEIRNQLESCLCTAEETKVIDFQGGVEDQWPLPRTEAEEW
ncbi:hypothetical protein OAL15_02775 [Flavobacteriales bacterium]|nr:hypothetical protein [Flavobacteriales bacterium]